MRWLTLITLLAAVEAASAETPVERGAYLVTLAGCSDCHTPGALLGQPDMKRRLAGADVGFGDPASGVWVGGNLTPDKDTGLGSWSADQIVAAITTGKTPEGRELSADHAVAGALASDARRFRAPSPPICKACRR